jgi:hypothetical protein
VHHHDVLLDALFAIAGMTAVALGVWRTESVASRRPMDYAGYALGIATITTVAARVGSNWGLRIAVIGMYSAAGASLGSTAAIVSAKRHAGAVLARLGTGATAGFKICSGIGCSCGMLAVVMQMLDAHRQIPLLQLIGQALLFSTLGLQTVVIAGNQWRLAEHGIIGTNVFVPWQRVAAWEWEDSNAVAIVLRPVFRRAPRFTIPVAADARDGVAAVLAGKIPVGSAGSAPAR